MMLQYLDFDLEIGEGSGRDYRVTARSSAGEARATMRFPYDELTLDSLLKDLQIALLSSGATQRQILEPEQKALRDFGLALFEALFTGEILNRYDVSLQQARSQGKGLRVRLRFQSPLTAALPWEYLFDPRGVEYCALNIETPLVRFVELPQPVLPLLVTPPLRILGMVSSPSDLPRLDVGQEKQRIERATQALRSTGRIELGWVPGQTWRDLQSALRQGPWHIFHFSGHGRFDRTTDEGQLAFADDQGEAQLLQASKVGLLLANHRTLRVAWLNACEGARGSKLDIFSSTASILVRRGIPAVVAMQYGISDRVAIELARTFYEALADGYPVDAALAEARVAVAMNNTVEWGTPVLFMRSPDGRVFDLSAPVALPVSPDQVLPQAEPRQKPEGRGTKTERQSEPGRSEPPPKQAPPPDLDERYSQALEHFYLDRWPEASAIFGEIIAQQPDYLDAAAKFEHASRQQTLATRYAEASKAYDATQWAAAIDHLEAVVALDPGYGDAAVRLAGAKQQHELADLYVEARRLFEAQAWQAVVKVFDRIRKLDAVYPDPEGLLPATLETLAAQERERKLAELYRQAVRDIDAGRLDDAHLGLEEVIERLPGYKHAEALLDRVRTTIARREAETQRQARLAELSRRATDLITARDWDEAEKALIELREAGASQDEVTAMLAEVGRQRNLETLYRQSLAHFQAQRWPEAAAALEEITRIDPAYAPPNHEQANALLARTRQAQQKAIDILTITTPFRLELVRVPAGEFWMGSDRMKDDKCQANEKPIHMLRLGQLYIGRHLVTNYQYGVFVRATKYEAPRTWNNGAIPSGRQEHPVVNVSWRDAVAFCQWLKKATGEPFRLPTEAEWEKAASWNERARQKRIWPWGDTFDAAKCNTAEGKKGGTTPVGAYSPAGDSPCGAADMAGNVWEWCASEYKGYPYDSGDGRENEDAWGDLQRVVRGGSFSSDARGARCAYRDHYFSSEWTGNYGFRVCVSPGP